MKKYVIIFVLFSAVAILYLSFPFSQKVQSRGKDFVYLEGNKFKLGKNDFYPVALNYISMLSSDGNEMWPCPTRDYYENPGSGYLPKDSALQQLRADFSLIKSLGFNTVRIVGIGETRCNERNQFSPLSVITYKNDHKTASVELKMDNYGQYFTALEMLFAELRQADLRGILLLRTRIDVIATHEHLGKMAKRFKEETGILAYDLFNEPLYFDSLEREKKVVFKNVKKWRKTVKKNAPQLVTIGLEGIREVFEWDPNILDVDFLSLHPYEYEPEQVRNEIYWYGKYIKKPWIIGETAIAADNDSVTYEEQRDFAKKTIKQTVDCGAIGYSWWQYKDVAWHSYHANFMGVITRQGETPVGNLVVHGTLKPVSEEFRKVDFNAQKDSCLCFGNYYNYSQHRQCRISGTLVNEENNPIEGGVILGWNEGWSDSYHTVTKADGSFELLGDFPFHHWMASATLHSMVRGDVLPDTAQTGKDSIPTMDIGIQKVYRLDF